jgi:hypothetical protein
MMSGKNSAMPLNGLRTVQQEYERRIQQFGEPRTSLRKSA